jgi:serine/threonine-protein kinase PpkA
MLAASFGASPEDPRAHGLELLRKLRGQIQFPAIIAIAEDGNELTAVRALQLGAVDYLPKRLLTPERLHTSVRLALRRLERRVARRLAELASEDNNAEQPKTDVAPVNGARAESIEEVESPQAPAVQPQPPAESTPAPSVADSTTVPHIKAPPANGASKRSEPDSAEFIPGYTIRMKIGESEKAVVYLATSLVLGHNVALKVSKTLRDDAAGRQFLEREYTAITAIRDRSVVRIYDYGVHAGFEYLAMEYLPHGDLKARMQSGVTEQEALRFVGQIAEALRVVHHAGLLHRDLKPPNVMLRENNDVSLIDFGLARALDGSTPSTRTGVLRGSPYYMSPEQALGEQLDARSDFYSLGIMFYEMLSGRKPYTGGTAMEVLQQHVHSPLPTLPLSLARYEPVLKRLLAKSRQERFEKAEEIIEVIATLRRTLLGEAESAKAESTAA